MPRPRFHKLPVERREEILDTAAHHFAQDGYEGASLNRILADCGLSKGAAYYYFDDKADLFATVVERAVDLVLVPSEVDWHSLDAESFWPEIESLYRRQLVTYREHPHLFRVAKLAAAAWSHPRDGHRIVERLAPLFEVFRQLLHRGTELGVLRTDLPMDLLVAMLGGLDDAIDTWFMNHPEAVQGPDGGPLVEAAFHAIRALVAHQEA